MEFKLDIFLSRHVDILYANIRKKAFAQYFSTFSSVDMNRMAAVFGTVVKELEIEVAILIEEEMLNCRIDSHNKVLREREIDLRSSTVEKCFALGDEFEETSEFLLMKMKLLNAGVVIKEEQGNRGGRNGGGGEQGGNDTPMVIGEGTSEGQGYNPFGLEGFMASGGDVISGGDAGDGTTFAQASGGGNGDSVYEEGQNGADADVGFEPMEISK